MDTTSEEAPPPPPLFPDHQLPAARYYTPDGSFNHPSLPPRGAVGSPSIRAHPPLHSYRIPPGDDDATNATTTTTTTPLLWHHPRLDLPSARDILVNLFQKSTPRNHSKSSQLSTAFGLFVTRDVSRTNFENGEDADMRIECDAIETRGPFCPEGRRYIEFHRAIRTTTSGGEDEDGGEDCGGETGEPINFATAWLDMDHVYGNHPPGSSDYLRYRTGSGGMMKLDDRTRLPPVNDTTGLYEVNDDVMRHLPMSLALTSTFLHHHNVRSAHHGALHPEWNDEAIFQEARMDVIAVYQNMFEEYYVPAVLGFPLSGYRGYDPDVDASIDVFFSTCSFRFGHSGVSGVSRLLDGRWEPLPQDPVLMRDAYNATESFVRAIDGPYRRRDRPSPAMAAVIRGLTHDATRAPDASFVDDMSLFMANSVVRNVQRGRDNGLPSYNDAREWFGLEPAGSYLDLAGGDAAVAGMLEGLYGEGNVDDVDAYVGAMMEAPASGDTDLGPLNEASVRDQWERLRNGDRLYYRARLKAEEIPNLPTFADLVREAWGADEMAHFPDEIFAVVGAGGDRGGVVDNTGGEMELLDGDLEIRWKEGRGYIDFTMIAPDRRVSGGYIGLGWKSNIMKGAEIWFCVSRMSDKDDDETCDLDETPPDKPSGDRGPFSCCVADGERHVAPDCDRTTRENYLMVLNSCASGKRSYVTVRARLCPSHSSEEERRDCFSHGGDMQFIAAYNPDDADVAHGFSRRNAGSANLAIGNVSTCSDDSAKAGLFALHGAVLLVAWLLLAPIAMYVVRYCKGKLWRLKVHITLVGVIIGLMFTLVFAAVVSVEGTSFGTADARSAAPSKHKTIGLSIICCIAFMVVTGELRRKRTLTKITKSVALERAVIISHRCGGLLLTGASWYNCYTGLVQIGPYESDSVEITLFSSKTVSLGYDLEFFGFFRKYIFFPWLGCVILTFIVTEARVRLAKNLEEKIMIGTGNDLTCANYEDLPLMSLETFLFMTRHGSELSIIDGHVVDISSFIEHHPGGANVLRFAVGSDITPYFFGVLDIHGQRHKHGPNALRALRRLVKWKLESEFKEESNVMRSSSMVSKGQERLSSMLGRKLSDCPSVLAAHVIRSAEIVGHEVVSAGNDSKNEKCIIKLSISMERNEDMDVLLGTPIPSSTFIFRHADSDGITERPYTAIGCRASVSRSVPRNLVSRLSSLNMQENSITSLLRLGSTDEKETIVYEFFITLIPGGKMSSVLARKTIGRRIMVKGPMASMAFLKKLNEQPWSDMCLITQGSGISSGLQLIDYFLQMKDPPRISLLWCVKDRHTDFENILKLADRERASPKFQYLVIEYKESTTDDVTDTQASELTRCDERDALLQLCQSGGIRHPKTVYAILSWASKVNNAEQNDVDKTPEDCALADLYRIGESLRIGLLLTDEMHDRPSGKCFRGCDLVSFIVNEDYTPSRESALTLGREIASKLKLLKHETDNEMILSDNADVYYMFCDDTPRLNLCNAKRKFFCHSHDMMKGMMKGMLLAVCGRIEFEAEISDLLKRAGAEEDQIFRFPDAMTPLSALSKFIPDRRRISLGRDVSPYADVPDEISVSLRSKTSGTSIKADESDARRVSWRAPMKDVSLDASNDNECNIILTGDIGDSALSNDASHSNFSDDGSEPDRPPATESGGIMA